MPYNVATIFRPLTRWVHAARKVLYGVAAHEIVLYAVRLRADMETLFILITIGDLIGVPILPPYYSLRLLPYLVPNIQTWKHRVLRERDILDIEGLDLFPG
ncbi:MAG: hypothetical protein N2559_11375 [Anaerolineae bacterium]|nr:hypothetical protein [Anaerolineae bacterium]